MNSSKAYKWLITGLCVMGVLTILGLLAREYGSNTHPSLPIGVHRSIDAELQVVCYTRAGQGISCVPCSSLKDGVCPSN